VTSEAVPVDFSQREVVTSVETAEPTSYRPTHRSVREDTLLARGRVPKGGDESFRSVSLTDRSPHLAAG
jgi:hypothetical protein